jgi:hypothetical protein
MGRISLQKTQVSRLFPARMARACMSSEMLCVTRAVAMEVNHHDERIDMTQLCTIPQAFYTKKYSTIFFFNPPASFVVHKNAKKKYRKPTNICMQMACSCMNFMAG